MRRSRLLRVAGRIASILGPDECLLVGGLAVGSHGYIRGTKDVDFVVRAPLDEIRKRLLKHGIAAVVSKGDPMEGDFACLRAMVDDVRVDAMPPLVALSWERGIEVPLSKTRHLRVVDLEGLYRLKLKAGGLKDLMDVAALALRHPESEPLVKELADSFGLAERLQIWLDDPRLKEEVQGTEEDRALQRLAERMRKPSKTGRVR
jgi:hypothetical protein